MGTTSSFPYAQTEQLAQPQSSIWTVHKGKRKEDGEPVTIFRCSTNNATMQAKNFAANLIRRLKTLRHPNVLKFIDSAETPDGLFLVTEAVEPLTQMWDSRTGLSSSMNDLECSIGLFQVANALKFMHTAGLVHTGLCVNAIWVTPAGEWKLSGLECAREFSDLRSDSLALLPQRYTPPDLAKGGSVSGADCPSIDSWSMGCFLFEIFNGEFNDPRQLTSVGKIPQEVFNEYKRLLATQPKNRLGMEQLQGSEYFQNDLVITVDFLDNLALKGNAEKDEFFRNLGDRVENFPAVI
jgi:SCY1-like protein 1